MTKVDDSGYAWLERLQEFAAPDTKKATLQLIDTLVPYLATLILMYLTIRWGAPVWVTLALSVPAGGFMVRAYLLIQLPTLFFAALVGIWLFYVQHQFDTTYWARLDDWQSLAASMQGSSFYKLPKVLQWISGNIGLHHIHHLMPRIPNYRLQDCIDAIPQLKLPKPLTFGRSIASVSMNLWNETGRRLISFRELRLHYSG